MLPIFIFTLVTVLAFGYAFLQFSAIRQKIMLGKNKQITGDTAQRLQNVVLIAFGQKKMFKRFIPAILHLFIYVAFLFTTIELIEILIDGFFGQHRFFADKIGVLYPIMINVVEVLSVLAFIGTIAFLYRRNVLKLPRFWSSEMTSWPRLDANLILIAEIVLIMAILSMNGADLLLQNLDPEHYPSTGPLLISSLTSGFFDGLPVTTLSTIERTGWWVHLLVVFGFLNYLPHSKHLHIMLAFPNTYFAKLSPRGEMDNMPEIMDEVKSMMGLSENSGEPDMSADLPEFGAKDIFDLDWTDIMGAYTCTECGRCTSVCPANLTGKKLSPRKVMMDIRDRTEEVASQMGINGRTVVDKDGFDDGKSLFDYISKEEIHACTTCNACVEACPVMINPLDPILKLRRYEILTESAGPADWLPMFNSLENSGSVWPVSEPRSSWTQNNE